MEEKGVLLLTWGNLYQYLLKKGWGWGWGGGGGGGGGHGSAPVPVLPSCYCTFSPFAAAMAEAYAMMLDRRGDSIFTCSGASRSVAVMQTTLLLPLLMVILYLMAFAN